MKTLLTFILGLTCMAMHGQLDLEQLEQPYEDYNWDMNPELHDIDPSLSEEDEVLVKSLEFREIVVTEAGGIVQYNTIHTITKVNSDAAVEDNNKIYLSTYETSDVVEQKARVIKTDGEVLELDDTDIEEAEDDDGVKTRYFALEGVEIGTEVEYLYKTKTFPDLDGASVYIQDEVPLLDFEFKLVYPAGFEMETKFYNTEKDSMNLDTINEVYHELNYELLDVPALKSQESAYYRPHLIKLAYKLKDNNYMGVNDVYSYGTESRSFFEDFMTMPIKKELKSSKKFIKAAALDDYTSEEDKVRALERYIKTNVSYFPFFFNNFFNLDFELAVTSAYKSNFADSRGLTKVFTNCLSQMGVEYELVLTCDRSRYAFDKDFESYLSMQEFLIYLPNIDMYIAPTKDDYYLGLIPGDWTDTHGLFIRKATLAGTETGIGKVKWIEALPPEVTKDNMVVECTINPEDLLVDMSFSRESHGYYALAYQPLFPLLDEDSREEVSETMATWMSEDLEVENVEVKNTAAEDLGVNPIIVSAEAETDLFISEAGDKILFKLGELIGPQMEMYDEEGSERTLPVDQEYTRYYTRAITVNIPDGYEVQNLDDLNLDVRHSRDGEELSVFVSTYTMEGNTITLNCEEYYRDVSLPVEEFAAYQSVINAAADFNKIVLVLKEK